MMVGSRNHCQWDPVFKTRRKLAPTENTPWVEARERKVEDRTPEDQDTPDIDAELDEESDARKFMREPDEGDACMPRVDKVDSFCSGAKLEFLKAKQWNVVDKLTPVALLNERMFEEGSERPRERRKLLTAHELYHELRKPVRHSHNQLNPVLRAQLSLMLT